MSYFELPQTLEEANVPIWFPQAGPQSEAISADWCPELLYGGARGGGKTDYLLGDFIKDVYKYKDAWQGILFRKTYDDLKHAIRRSQQLLAGSKDCIWRATAKEWRWDNGAVLRFAYLDNVADANRYQGHEFTWIGWDEVAQWHSDEAYLMLIACLRSPSAVPTKRIRTTANPGGIGHLWVKERFIDIAPKGYLPYDDPDTNMTRMFIPSSVTDNKILLDKDPGYIDRLKGVGSPDLVKAWLEGDWSIIKGAYFPEFSMSRHVVRPFKIPSHWLKFRAFDWGSASPFACVWFAVSDGTHPHIPKGCLVCYREWYGASKPNKGLHMKNDLIARGIKKKEARGEVLTYSVADPAMFKSEGGISIAETFYRNGVNLRKADNARIPGWAQLRARLIGNNDGAMIVFFDTLIHTIRTLPALQHDEKKPEDVNTDGDDHLADAIRYGCQSRPYIVNRKVMPKRANTLTYNDVSKQLDSVHNQVAKIVRGPL